MFLTETHVCFQCIYRLVFNGISFQNSLRLVESTNIAFAEWIMRTIHQSDTVGSLRHKIKQSPKEDVPGEDDSLDFHPGSLLLLKFLFELLHHLLAYRIATVTANRYHHSPRPTVDVVLKCGIQRPSNKDAISFVSRSPGD